MVHHWINPIVVLPYILNRRMWFCCLSHLYVGSQVVSEAEKKWRIKLLLVLKSHGFAYTYGVLRMQSSSLTRSWQPHLVFREQISFATLDHSRLNVIFHYLFTSRQKHLWGEIWWWKFQVKTLWPWMAKHGKCRKRYKWFAVLYNNSENILAGWQTCCFWQSYRRHGKVRQDFLVCLNSK